jgi:hypothetical protein
MFMSSRLIFYNLQKQRTFYIYIKMSLQEFVQQLAITY